MTAPRTFRCFGVGPSFLAADGPGVTEELERLALRCMEESQMRSAASDEEALRQLRTELACVHHPDTLLAVSRDATSEVLAAATVSELEFDSRIYNRKMGRLWLLLPLGGEGRRAAVRELVAEVTGGASAVGYRHLCARVPATEHETVHTLEHAGFRSMGMQITLGTRCGSTVSPLPADGLVLRSFVPEDLPALQEFSAEAFSQSRLFVDPDLPREKTKLLQQKWLENDCAGRAAKVYVAQLDGRPVGYIACLLHEAVPERGIGSCGDIDLVAVSPRARGRGIGMALVREALVWFGSRTERVIVKTQLTNYPAIGLYQRAGFIMQSSFHTLHLSLEPSCQTLS